MKWAYLTEDRDFAQLVPLDNLPKEIKWTGPTASFDVDPLTVEDCWWEGKEFHNGHTQFTYREKWEDAVDTGTTMFDDCFLFFKDDAALERHWQESQTLPHDRAVLYQDWAWYNKMNIERR